MSEILDYTIENVKKSKAAFCRFITANDTGKNGSHQAGFYIPKCAAKLLFETPGVKGQNKDKTVKVKWQNDFTTDSRFIYYGEKTRNEYRITRFGKGFPFFEDNNVGDLLIITKETEDYYNGMILQTDEDIDSFMAYFNLSSEMTNQLISIDNVQSPDKRFDASFAEFINKYTDFPETTVMAQFARECYNQSYQISRNGICKDPDLYILKWIESEYELFRRLEEKIYSAIYKNAFNNCQALIDFANSILNRRKSRAGKSLEHHLATVFTIANLKFEEQVVTEDNKKPDFIFPNGEAYHNLLFPAEKLVFLGAKTTCKDRWRQVLNEANRIDTKFLFTLQQGISKNQLKEMKHEHLILVVPQAYKKFFDKEYQDEIYTLSSFINFVHETQQTNPYITIP